jgi:hypothetical protein
VGSFRRTRFQVDYVMQAYSTRLSLRASDIGSRA